MRNVDLYNNIKERFYDNSLYSSNNALVLAGDSLEILKSIPDNSISLILTDPPYHSTKKKNIYGDTFFQEDREYLIWINSFAKEWKRILKPSGSVFCFCSTKMVSKLAYTFSENFNILSEIVWTKPNEPGFDGWKQKMKKESLRQWYGYSERILFMEKAVDGNLNRSYFGDFLLKMRKKVHLSAKELAEMIGAYGKVNHGGSISNWEAGRNVPSKEQYDKLVDALKSCEKTIIMPKYEDIIRPFFINKEMEFTDVWNFPNVKPYKGKHPAEKPVSMLEHAIKATTYEGDIVLDCFAGSGSTAVAALKNNRRSISIEIERRWVDNIINLMKKIDNGAKSTFPNNYKERLA